jgi:hypothetical protein
MEHPCTSVIPATQEAEAGVSQIQGQFGQLSKILPQNKIKKGWGYSLGVQSLPSMFWVWSPEPQKKGKNDLIYMFSKEKS